MNKPERVLTEEELNNYEHYSDVIELAKIFNHDIIEDDQGTFRFKLSKLMDHLYSNCPIYTGKEYGQYSPRYRGHLELNVLWRDFRSKYFPVEDLVKFYMNIGYSLSGFAEVFGQVEAEEWNLEGAKKVPKNHTCEYYIQTPIDYLIEKYKGKVLKI